MARRSQCSSAGDNPLDPNYLPPHYREEYRLAIDALLEADVEGYYGLLQEVNVVDFLSQSEIEYIKCMVQVPHQSLQPDRRYMVGEGDGSSDTYWPTHSDLDAPGLDLGWPQPQRFVGPTEITTLVNPSDPDMPTIKEHVRRMIRNAQQVVAVVMDMFSDVDIFAEILNAAMRKVAVYVLLDEVNSHHFVAMANNCKVNLDEIKFMRVRTIPGSTYLCHTGKSFKGQMMNRFILVDCKIALSGSYSFMWSFEKIHRCMAHVFLGQLVNTFDEEFRILYAQSEPLVVENRMTYVEDLGNFPGRQYEPTYKRVYPPIKNIHSEWLGHSFEENMMVDPNLLQFRRVGSVSSSTEEHIPPQIHNTQHYRGESSFLEQRKFLKGPNTKDISGFRRPGYTEDPSQFYVYPQNNTGNRGKQHLEDMEIQRAHLPREQYFNQRTGPDPPYEMYSKPRDHGYYQQTDTFAEPGYPQEMDVDVLGDYNHVQRCIQSRSTLETGPTGQLLVPVQSNPKRHSIGQSYACQISPTQVNLPEQKYFFNVHNKHQERKEGLRDWRISSYLTALQSTGEEDMAHLQRTDSFDNLSYVQKGRSYEPEISETRPDNKMSKSNPFPVPTLNSLALPERIADHTFIRNAKPIQPATSEPTPPAPLVPTPPTTSESSCTAEGEKVNDMQNKETKEINLIHEEFVRKRPNIALQRSSRLRHSLIFYPNLEQHTSEENDSNLKDADDPLKTSPAVSNILEKKKPVTREPFQWNNPVRSLCDLSSNLQKKSEVNSGEGQDKNSEIDQKDACEEKTLVSHKDQSQDVLAESSQSTQIPFPALQRSASFVNMDDPECRLRFFKELAAKRKAEALAKQSKATKDTVTTETEKFLTKNTVDETAKKSWDAVVTHPPPKSIIEDSQGSGDKQQRPEKQHDKNIMHKISPDPMITEKNAPECDNSHIPTTATDAEKIKLKKKLCEDYDSSSNAVQEKNTPSANPVLQLSTKPNVTCPSSLTLNASVPDFVSGVAILPRDSSLPTLLSHQPSTLNISVPSKHLSADSSSYSATPEKGNAMCIASRDTDSTTHINQHPLQYSSESELKPSQYSTALKTDISQSPTGEDIRPLQQTATAEAGPPQQCIVTKTDTLQHLTATESCPFQHIKTKTDPSHHSTTTKTGIPQHYSATETCPLQLSVLTGSSLYQQNTAAKMDNLQHPTAAQTDLFNQTMKAETTPPQHSTPTNKETPEVPIPSESIPSTDHTATELDTQHPAAAETGQFQQPTVSVTLNSSSATKTEGHELPIIIETGPSQHPNVDTLQKSSATETELLHHTTAAETNPLQQSNATKPEKLRISITAETIPLQDPTAAQLNTLQHPTAAETGSLQQPFEAKTVFPQPSTPTKTDTHNLLVIRESCSSQHPVTPNVDTLQNPSAKEKELFHHATTTETSPPFQSVATNVETLQKPSATERGLFHNTTIETSPPQPNATKTETLPITAETIPLQDPTEAKLDTLQHPTAAETGSLNQPTRAKTIPPQISTPTKTDTHELPVTTESGSSQNTVTPNVETLQKTSATETGLFHKATTTHTCLLQQSNATKTETVTIPITAETISLQDPTAAQLNTLKHSTATDTGPTPSQPSTATKTETHELPITTESSPSQQHVAANVDALKNPKTPSAIETGHFYHTTTSEAIPPEQSNATKTETVRIPITAETISFQDPTAAQLNTLKHSTATDTGLTPSQPSIATKTETHELPIKTESSPSQQHVAANADALKNPSAIETGHFYHTTTAEAIPPEQSNATKTETLRVPITAETIPSQDPTAAQLDTLQHPTATDTGSFQQLTTAVPTQQTKKETDLHIKIESGLSQHPVAANVDTVQNLSATETGAFHHTTTGESSFSLQSAETKTEMLHNTTETIPSQDPISTKTDAQHPTATETSPFQPTTKADNSLLQDSPETLQLIKVGSSQHPAETVMDTLQNFTAADAGTLQHTTTAEMSSPQQFSATVSEIAQLSSTTETSFFHDSAAATKQLDTQCTTTITETDSSIVTETADIPQHPSGMETDPFQSCSATKTDTPQPPSAKETCSFQDLTTPKDTSQLLIDADKGLIQEPTTPSGPLQNPSPTEPDTYQCSTATGNFPHAAESDALCPVTSGPCTVLTSNLNDTSIAPTLPSTQTQSALSIVEEMSNTSPISDPVASISSSTTSTKDTGSCTVETDSSTTDSAHFSGSQSPKITVAIDISAAQSGTSQDITSSGITQVEDSQTKTSSINHILSPEDKSDDQKCLNLVSNTTSAPQTKENCKHTTSDAGSSPLVFDKGSSKADSFDNTLQSPAKGPKEPSGLDSCSDTTTPETSENITLLETSSLTEHSYRKETAQKDKDIRNQKSSVSPDKSSLSILQSSTANVLSCSNLRDDTKVLLEQISVKNQGRASKLTPGDAKENDTNGNTKTDNKMPASQSSARTWSSQASAEERQHLLKKMESMRKEKRVYSRFEVP